MTANSIWFPILYSFEKRVKSATKGVLSRLESIKIVFVYVCGLTPEALRSSRCYPWPPSQPERRYPLPILHPINAFGVLVSVPLAPNAGDAIGSRTKESLLRHVLNWMASLCKALLVWCPSKRNWLIDRQRHTKKDVDRDKDSQGHTYLKPVDGAAVNQRRKHAKSAAESVSDGTHCKHNVKVLFHTLNEVVVHWERRHVKLTTLQYPQQHVPTTAMQQDLKSWQFICPFWRTKISLRVGLLSV